MGEICFIVFFLLGGYFFWAGKFWKPKKEILGKSGRKGWGRFFRNGVIFLLVAGRERFGWKIKGDRLERMKKLYVGKGEQDVFYHYYTKAGCLVSAVTMFCMLLIAASGLITQKRELLDGYFLKREDALGQEKTVDLAASFGEEEKEVAVAVPNVQYTEQELEKKFQEAKAYIDSKYLGENRSADQVSKPLCLPSSIPGSAVAITWQLGVDALVQADGSISNENLEESRQIEITAVLTYGEHKEAVPRQLTILPRQRTEEDRHWDSWKQQLEISQKNSLTKEYLELPQQVEGKPVSYQEKQLSISSILLGLSLFGILAVVMLLEEGLQKELRKREQELKADYPDFIEHFVLLIGAGMSVKGAWERIASDYQETKQPEKKQYVYEEMLVSVREMENGMGEARSYELFGKRTGLLPYMKFCTLIVQNLKKGSDDLLHLLEYEVADAFRERKERAKSLGEEAGTKLLLPMMLMLVIVFAIILYAAFYNM